MNITEEQLDEIKGASNTLASLCEDKGTEEFIKKIFLFISESLNRIIKEIENGEVKNGPK